ncbi:armadillo-type protein [Tricharina praecox]|uniref:armadillo-type protein n=1 Tax=Tricharina praecox TaxID=43433 RepID=UPI00222077C8|nr:armadillo-type protein [Tricharina praecox]KAI5842028.1 armadillo-type protein [Tricharina praecox]
MSAPAAYALQSLLDKMSNPDSDFRFMSLNDLLAMLTQNLSFSQTDPGTMSKLIDAVVKALDDANGEVQNLAVKCLGPLVLKVKENQIGPLIDRLATLSMTSQDPSIPSTALRTIITNLPRPHASPGMNLASIAALHQAHAAAPSTMARPEATQQAIQTSVTAVQKTLIPKLMILLKPDGGESGKATAGATLDSVDLLIETVRCFGSIMSGAEVERLQVAVMNLVQSERTSGVIKKRAVTALSLLCVYAPDELLSSFINHLIESFRAESKHVNPGRLRLLISVTGSLARGIPERFGPYLKTLCPFILSVVDGRDLENRDLGDEPDMEMDEVREVALVALESFQSCCTEEMKQFTDDLLNAGTVFLKYDPNYADPGDDDEEMGGTAGGDDDDGEFGGSDDDDTFEDDGNFSDEDDISWKVRRCAAKLLATVLATRAGDLIRGSGEGGGLAYKKVAPLLIDRFHEREENVRLEILATAIVLVKKTGEVADGTITCGPALSSAAGTMAPPPKKRRGSDASMMDTDMALEVPSVDEHGVRDSLFQLVPRLSKSVGKLLNNKSITLPTKQASIVLISAAVSVLHGKFESSLNIFINALVDAAGGGNALASGGNVVVASAPGGSAATATGASVRIEVLRLFSKIFDNHSLEAVEPYLAAAVPAVCAAVNETAYKVSFEALGTVASIAKLLTSPGAPAYAEHLKQLYQVIIKKVENADTDLEVREKAIVTMSILLGRTSGKAGTLSAESRRHALDVLLERLKNETTRASAARAIDNIARSAGDDGSISEEWVRKVVTELGAQLRKSNRSLRAASLVALESIASNPALLHQMDTASKSELVAVLTPLLVVGDMQLLALAIAVLRLMIINPNGITISFEVINGICNLVKFPLGSGLVLENLLSLVRTIGEEDKKGKRKLMEELLKKVGVTGDMSAVGKVIAQLLVCGGGDKGGFIVGVKDFVEEFETARDSGRKCLGLIVLGEIGLRMGKDFDVPPEKFLGQLGDDSDNVPIAAAVALGLAGAGNVDKFVPVIMKRLQDGNDSYLLVHSLKEIITHSSADSLKSYTNDMWNTLLSTAVTNDDAKAVAAECVGRLIILDPYSFLPELQKHMTSPQSVVRGLVISALRYTFTDTDTKYDELLRPTVVDFLDTMLQDSELDNRRLALTTLNSAATNKAHLLAGPGLERLLPRVYSESVIKPDLVREIQMGPFRHRIDDGLEVRKSAYETLYALLETSFHNIELDVYFSRVIAGIADDHDIRALANLMLAKLAVLAKEETARRLDSIADTIRKVLMEKPKENAVKQELERHAEGVRGVVKTALVVHREVGAERGGQKWRGFWDWICASWRELVTENSENEGK